jgi:S1-C subfamily serine protease
VQPNDIILSVNRQPVSNVSQVTRVLQSAQPGTPVFLLVWRVGPNGGTETLVTMTKR